MSNTLKAALALLLSGFAMQAAAESGPNPANDTMACSVSVEYKRNNVSRLVYTKDFTVAPDAPFSDDFSTATRFRFFDATVARVDGIPEVAAVFDADVDVFNAVDFGTVLKVHDESKGETQTGNSSFFTSVPGAAGSHRTEYTLTCARAKN
ncbi:MAG: hypothetical protein ABL934_15435 [Lysobacteraceae bacterium]